MRAHQIMTRSVITIAPDATILEAAKTMLQHHVSGLPVVDAAGKLVGIVSEGDFIRRSEISTERKRGRWLNSCLAPAQKQPISFVSWPQGFRSHDPRSDHRHRRRDRWKKSSMRWRTNGIKRLPVMTGDKLVGIVSRANLLRAVASLAREIPDPTADDDHIRGRVIAATLKNDWRPTGLMSGPQRRRPSHGLINDERSRRAAIRGGKHRGRQGGA